MHKSRRFRQPGTQAQTLRVPADNPATGTVIAFAHNPIATALRIAEALPELRVDATWNDEYEEAVHVTGADQPMGSGVYVAAGQQLVIADDGRISVEGDGDD